MSECNCNSQYQKTDAEKAQEIRMICLQMAIQTNGGIVDAEQMYNYITTGKIPTPE